jgi:hypothetical protein
MKLPTLRVIYGGLYCRLFYSPGKIYNFTRYQLIPLEKSPSYQSLHSIVHKYYSTPLFPVLRNKVSVHIGCMKFDEIPDSLNSFVPSTCLAVAFAVPSGCHWWRWSSGSLLPGENEAESPHE